eukprot:scaffold5213_cov113-Isochrysis_galbana.AAC.10
MAAASPITAARERRCKWCCIKECGLDVARPYLVRSTAETPDARLERERGCEVGAWRHDKSHPSALTTSNGRMDSVSHRIDPAHVQCASPRAQPPLHHV